MCVDPTKSYLFDKTLLEQLDYTSSDINTKHQLSASNPGQGLYMRSLCQDDNHKGYLELLSELTTVGDVTEQMFTERFNAMKSCLNTYYIVVVEDIAVSRIVSTSTLVVEHHMNSSFEITKKGRIEDVVVADTHRGKRLGQLLLETLILLAEKVNCNEVSLECKDRTVDFYARFGFELQNGLRYMTKRISH